MPLPNKPHSRTGTGFPKAIHTPTRMKTLAYRTRSSSPSLQSSTTDAICRKTWRFLLAGLLTPSLAILPLPAAEKTPEELPLSIFCVEFAATLKSVYLKNSGDEHAKVDLSTANVVAAGMTRLEAGTISLYGPPLSGSEYPVVASVKPGAIRAPLMVLVPNPNAEGPRYHSKVVDMDNNRFPLGSYQIVNLSPHPLRFKTEDKATEIPPNAELLFNPAIKEGEVAAVTVEYKPGQDWLVISSSRWAGRKDRRSLVCVHQNPQSQRMLIKSIPLRE